MIDILSESKAVLEYAVEIRRHLHRYPEPTSREFNTVRYIIAKLEALGIPYENVPDGGVLGYIEGAGQDRTVLLRADCDALTMQESPDNARGPKVCVSENDGVAHMCGHDAHVAMLLGAAKILNEHKDLLTGRVILLFERGEEGGNCIYYVMKHIQKNQIAIDGCWANHVSVDYPVGKVGISGGRDNAGNVNFQVLLTGHGGHASRPDLSNNPVDCFVAIYNCLKDIRMRNISPDIPLTYSVGILEGGHKRNVIPHTLRFGGTCRFYDAPSGKAFKEQLKEVIDSNCRIYRCIPEYEVFTGPSLPLVSNETCAEIGRKALMEALGADAVVVSEPSMGSESFATLAAYYPSVMARIGVRNEEKGITEGGHNPGFDLDEEGMIYGIAAHAAYAIAFLKDGRTIPFTPYEGTADDLLAYMARPVPDRFDPQEA